MSAVVMACMATSRRVSRTERGMFVPTSRPPPRPVASKIQNLLPRVTPPLNPQLDTPLGDLADETWKDAG